jgi:ribose transport system substrate-binding protein
VFGAGPARLYEYGPVGLQLRHDTMAPRRTSVPIPTPASTPARLTRRSLLGAGLATFGAPVLAACGDGSSKGGGSGGPTAPLAFVYIPGIDGVPFYAMIRKGAQAAASSANVKLTYSAAPAWDPVAQTRLVDGAISQRVDGIIIAPTDAQAMTAPLRRADQAGIKVITVDTFVGTGDYTTGDVTFPVAYVGSDNVQGGRTAGEALVKAIGGKGGVYLQNNDPQASTSVQRAQGFRAAVAATGGAVTVVGEQFDKGDIATATQQTSAVLAGPRGATLSGIFGATGYSARGAAAAVANDHRGGEVKVAAFDADEATIADLRAGRVDLVIAQKPASMGQQAVILLAAAVRGNPTGPRHVGTDFVVIDRSTMDTAEARAAVYSA